MRDQTPKLEPQGYLTAEEFLEQARAKPGEETVGERPAGTTTGSYRFNPETGEQTCEVKAGGQTLHGRAGQVVATWRNPSLHAGPEYEVKAGGHVFHSEDAFETVRRTARAQYFRRQAASVRVPPPKRSRRLDRRLGCGRPAHRRSSRSTSRGDPSDLDPPPRSPVALEGVAG
jgi:hypothetical protein